MKRIYFLLIASAGIMLISCEDTSSKNTVVLDATNHEQNQKADVDSQTNKLNEKITSERSKEKFLITNNSLGYFKIGGTWQEFSKNDYDYKFVQSYGSCTDACCDGGFDLGKIISNDNQEKIIKNPAITIGALSFGKSESKTANKNNPNVFYISSDNCSGWYWKDKISYLITTSEAFKTKEGIGVGTTLEKMDEIFGKIIINIGWVEESANAIVIKVKPYSDIEFILEAEDAIGELNTSESATISDFKKNTKIRRLIIRGKE